MAMRFTPKELDALKPRNKRYEVSASNIDSLSLRVTPRGVKTFVYMYWFDDRVRRMTLGRYPEMSLLAATSAVADARIERRSGKIDPAARAQADRVAEINAGTVAELVSEYIEKYAKKNKKTWQEDERSLKKDVLPKWRNRKAKDITRRDIVLLLDGIVDRGAPVMANHVRTLISKVFKVGVQRGLIETSPCIALDKPTKEKTRNRILSDEEIATIWPLLDTNRIHKAIQRAIKLLLITGQRRGEITNAEWREIDLNAATWTIPAHKAKNGLEHTVPLSEPAIELMRELKELAMGSKFLLPSPHGTAQDDKPMSERAITRAVANNREGFGIDHWTPHDLRRTAASIMARLGTDRLVLKKVLNHVDDDITAVYDRHTYEAEKRAALDKLASHISALTN